MPTSAFCEDVLFRNAIIDALSHWLERKPAPDLGTLDVVFRQAHITTDLKDFLVGLMTIVIEETAESRPYTAFNSMEWHAWKFEDAIDDKKLSEDQNLPWQIDNLNGTSCKGELFTKKRSNSQVTDLATEDIVKYL